MGIGTAPQAARRSGAVDQLDANCPCQGQMKVFLSLASKHVEEVLFMSKSAGIFTAQLVEHLTTPSRLSPKPIVRYPSNPVAITALNVIGTLHHFHLQIVPTILAHQNAYPPPASDTNILNIFVPYHY